uniref:Multiple epidermal growth factor-like domains protein 11 n=1 Tax=Crassostrea virginica TaxID=6565 RepID=A0A8B8CB40_CRAVI|nr:multiple epidermal growth factor-like domains protein 11 [Crassostrea virginica]
MIWILSATLFFSLISFVRSYENMALNKPAWHEHPYHKDQWGADLAVDGQYSDRSAQGGQCTISANCQSTAQWKVDLGEILDVSHIVIYYRTDNHIWDDDNPSVARFLGFSVYLSNTTNYEDGVLCVEDSQYTRSSIPNPVYISCPYNGRYVIYSNNRTQSSIPDGYSEYAFNELCEVEVYDCATPGFYGKRCSSRCPTNCLNGHCNRRGECLGCIRGHQGVHCDKECKNYTYGSGCTRTCGECKHGEQCDHVTGSCPNGCDRGIHGVKCDKVCPVWEGRYGYNCQENCSMNCLHGVCDRRSGQCFMGCEVGWKGTTCLTKCDGGTYGADCRYHCGHCLDKQQCDAIDGSCLNGCGSGYFGAKCTEICGNKTFGPACSLTCGNCIYQSNEQCDHVTGHCPRGCVVGYSGKRCNDLCGNNTYGPGCSLPCGNCHYKYGEQCHHVTGQCPSACAEGFKGKRCDEGYVRSSSSDVDNRLLIPAYLTASVLFISVVLNIVLIMKRKQINNKETQPKQEEGYENVTWSYEGSDAHSASDYEPMNIFSPVYEAANITSPDYESMNRISPDYEAANITSPVYEAVNITSPDYEPMNIISPVYKALN